MGIITPGKRTVFLSGRIGSVSGICVIVILSSSSSEISGIKSESSLTDDERKKSDNLFSCNLLIYFNSTKI
jgi:hypothetical protein